MTTEQLVKYLKEGTTGSDVTKTDFFLDSLMRQAADKIEELLQRNSELSWMVSNNRETQDYDRTQWI